MSRLTRPVLGGILGRQELPSPDVIVSCSQPEIVSRRDMRSGRTTCGWGSQARPQQVVHDVAKRNPTPPNASLDLNR